MKSAEEWAHETLGVESREDEIKLIKQIQLDAWKQGMTDAAKVETATAAHDIYNERDNRKEI